MTSIAVEAKSQIGMKALCVFSGGLDSMLAVQLIRAQGIDVLALFFETPFFTSRKAEESALSMGLPLKVVDITERHLEIVKHPKHGYGGNMNPCIDCHALMFRIAGEYLDRENADFIITGEVLGQRPMSQNKKSLSLVASESGCEGLLLRPLSARHLPRTVPEEKGWVNRELLAGLQGRSRKPQMEMARQFNIEKYPSPAGGCLLTEKAFSRRLKDLLRFRKNPEVREIELLKLGRHFRISPHAKLIAGRNRKENRKILSHATPDDIILSYAEGPGPAVLGIGEFDDKSMEVAMGIAAAYSDAEDGTEALLKVIREDSERRWHIRCPAKKTFRGYLL